MVNIKLVKSVEAMRDGVHSSVILLESSLMEVNPVPEDVFWDYCLMWSWWGRFACV